MIENFKGKHILHGNQFSKEDLDKVVKNMKKDREQNKEHNSYWMNTIWIIHAIFIISSKI